MNNLSNTLKIAKKKLQSVNISSGYMNSLDNLNSFSSQNNLVKLKNNLKNLHGKLDFARQAADTVNIFFSITFIKKNNEYE